MQPRLTGSNHKTAALWNRGLVLRLLRQYGQLSRRQVVQMVGLRGSTLTYIMRELMDRDIIRTAGKLESKRVGQKQVMLTINPDVGWALGVGLGEGRASMVLVDAAGRLLAQHALAIGRDLAAVPKELQAGLARWFKTQPTPAGRFLALGVGVPGVVDTAAGVVVRSTVFDATGVPLRKALADQFSTLAVIDHDACFGALAESAGGASSGQSHFLYLVIDDTDAEDGSAVVSAYGSSFYLNGTIYRGANYAAGELIDALAPPVVTLSAEERAALATPQTELSDRLREFADALARSLAMMVNLVDVSVVVLAGTTGIANDAFLGRVQAFLQSKSIHLPGRQLQVLAARTQSNAVAHGASSAALALSDETFADTRNPGQFDA